MKAGPQHDFYERFDDIPFHRDLGIRLTSWGEGKGRITLHRTPDTPQGIGGSVQGGVLATMVDLVALVAVFSELDENQVPAGTADLNISYLRTTQSDLVHADGTVIKRGRQLAVVDVRIIDGDDRLCSIGKVMYAFRAGAQ